MRGLIFSTFAVVALFCGFAEESSWQKPRTTRRYLHPPLAQNMFTLWNDGKIIRGDVVHHHDWSDWYYNLKSDVLWVLHGEKDEPFDFKTAKNRLPKDGVPFHGLTWRKEGFEISLDASCETGVRAPACFIRLEVKNDGSAKNGLPMAIMLRRMREYYAVKGSPDIYEPYDTQIDYFRNSEPLEYRQSTFTNMWKSSSAIAVFSCAASTTNVFDVVTLTNALKNASAGDVIVMKKGVYDASSLRAIRLLCRSLVTDIHYWS